MMEIVPYNMACAYCHARWRDPKGSQTGYVDIGACEKHAGKKQHDKSYQRHSYYKKIGYEGAKRGIVRWKEAQG